MESALTEGLGAFAVTACAAGAAERAMSPAAVTISPVRRDAGWNLKRASLGSGQALLACPGVAWQWALGSRRRQEDLGLLQALPERGVRTGCLATSTLTNV